MLFAWLTATLLLVQSFDVDVVVTWVDAQPEHASDSPAAKACSSAFATSANRFGSSFHTFRYALRSIERYMPWVRAVWVVTNGELPCWLHQPELGNETAGPELRMITHADIWPPEAAESDLPTFNSLAIETHIHRIRGLAEHFIKWDDDMLAGRPLSRSFFFSDEGVPLLPRGDQRHVSGPLLRQAKQAYVERTVQEAERLVAIRKIAAGRGLEDVAHAGKETGRSRKRLRKQADKWREPQRTRAIEASTARQESTKKREGAKVLAHLGHLRKGPSDVPMLAHGPVPARRSHIVEVQSLWPDYFRELSSARCRTADMVNRPTLIHTMCAAQR